MKSFIFICTSIFSSLLVSAQLYQTNEIANFYLNNPTAIENESGRAELAHFIRGGVVDNNNNQQSTSFYKALNGKHYIGSVLQLNQFNLTQLTTVRLNYAYQLKLGKTHALTGGVAAGVGYFGYNTGKLGDDFFQESVEVREQIDDQYLSLLGVGLGYQLKNQFYFGLGYTRFGAIGQLLSVQSSFKQTILNNALLIQPRMLFQTDVEQFNIIEFGAAFDIYQSLQLGIYYASNKTIKTEVGVRYRGIGLMYKIHHQQLAETIIDPLTHGFAVSFNFNQQTKIRKPRKQI